MTTPELCNACEKKFPGDRWMLALNSQCVAIETCRNCKPGSIEIKYNPQADVSFNETSSSAACGEHEYQEPSSDLEKLTEDNIRKVETGDKIQFKELNGELSLLNVTGHSKRGETIEGRVKAPSGQMLRRAFNYKQMYKQQGHVLFEFPEQRDNWDDRIDVPRDFHMTEDFNEKIFFEMVKRNYFVTISFSKASYGEISKFIERAVEYGITSLKNGVRYSKDVAISPWKAFVYLALKNRELKDKLEAGEISKEEYESQRQEYQKYFGKASVVIGGVSGGLLASGTASFLMSRVQNTIIQELISNFSKPGYLPVENINVTRKILLYIQSQTAVGSLELLCQWYPRLAWVVEAAGGPSAFLGMGALTFIVAGGLLGWYLHRTYINKPAIKAWGAKMAEKNVK